MSIGRKTMRVMGGIGFAAVIAAAGQSARAALMLTMSEPSFATATITDVGNTGSLSYFGTYGDFQTNFVVGLSNKLSGGGSTPATLQIETISVKNMSTSGITKTITLTLTDDGYTFPGTGGTTVQLDSAFAGTISNSIAGDTLAFQSYVIAPPVTTGSQAVTILVSNPLSQSFSNDAVPVQFTRPAAYNLQNVLTMSLTANGEQANVSGTTTISLAPIVPEPASMGLAAMGLALVAKRASRRSAR